MARMSAANVTSSPVTASKPCPIATVERRVVRSSTTSWVLMVNMSGGLGDVGLAGQAQPAQDAQGLDHVHGSEPSVGLAQVVLDRLFADAQLVGDLTVCLALGLADEHVALTRRE